MARDFEEFDMYFAGPDCGITKRLSIKCELLDEKIRVYSAKAWIDEVEEEIYEEQNDAEGREALKIARDEARLARLAVLDLIGKSYRHMDAVWDACKRAIRDVLKGADFS